MPFGAAAAVVGAGASLAGGIMGANAAKSAASAESNAIQKGLDFQEGVYNTTQTNMQPWIGGGQQALGSLLGFYGLPGGNPGGANAAFQQFTGLPSYQFPLQQGNLAVNRMLASTGLTNSGGAIKDAAAYNQGYASQGLQGYLSGLSGLSGGGLSAAGTLGSQGNQAAQSVLQGSTNQGIAQGAGIIGANNALNKGIQNAVPALFGGGAGGSSGSSYGGIGSALSGIGTGIGNVATGNQWDGMAGWGTMPGLVSQANTNVQNGGPY